MLNFKSLVLTAFEEEGGRRNLLDVTSDEGKKQQKTNLMLTTVQKLYNRRHYPDGVSIIRRKLLT